MADKPVLPIEILLQLPRNTQKVVQDLKKQFESVGIDIKLNKIDSRALLQQIDSQSAKIRGALARTIAVNPQTSQTSLRALLQTNRALESARSLSHQLGEQTAITGKRFTVYLLASKALYGLTNALSGSLRQAIEFDREIAKVAQLRNTSLRETSSITRNINTLSTSYGISAKSLAGVANQLAEAGKSISEINSILKGLGPASLLPTFTDIEGNVEKVVAALNQFEIAASDTSKVLDILNSVSKDFTVSVDELLTGLQRSGKSFSVLAGIKGPDQQNIDRFKEYVALFTSVISVNRESAEAIGTSFRTILPRLQRQSVRDQLKNLGVTLDDAQGNFIGPYEAILRIGEALDQINPKSRQFARILEEIGGLRQQSRTAALVLGTDTARRALSLANQSEGSVISDAAKVQQVLQIEINKTREEFNRFIREVVASGEFQILTKTFLGWAQALLQVATVAKDLVPLFAGLTALRFLPTLVPFGQGFFGQIGRTRLGRNSGGLIPTLLTPGEQVLFPDAVRREGVGRLNKINQRGGMLKSYKDVYTVSGSGNTDSVPMDLPGGSYVLRKKMAGGGLLQALVRLGIDPNTIQPNIPGQIGNTVQNIFKSIGTKTGYIPGRAPFNAVINAKRTAALFTRKSTIGSVGDELAHAVGLDKLGAIPGIENRLDQLAPERAAAFDASAPRGIYGTTNPKTLSNIRRQELRAAVVAKAVSGTFGKSGLAGLESIVSKAGSEQEAKTIAKEFLTNQTKIYTEAKLLSRNSKQFESILGKARRKYERLVNDFKANPLEASRIVAEAVTKSPNLRAVDRNLAATVAGGQAGVDAKIFQSAVGDPTYSRPRTLRSLIRRTNLKEGDSQLIGQVLKTVGGNREQAVALLSNNLGTGLDLDRDRIERALANQGLSLSAPGRGLRERTSAIPRTPLLTRVRGTIGRFGTEGRDLLRNIRGTQQLTQGQFNARTYGAGFIAAAGAGLAGSSTSATGQAVGSGIAGGAGVVGTLSLIGITNPFTIAIAAASAAAYSMVKAFNSASDAAIARSVADKTATIAASKTPFAALTKADREKFTFGGDAAVLAEARAFATGQRRFKIRQEGAGRFTGAAAALNTDDVNIFSQISRRFSGNDRNLSLALARARETEISKAREQARPLFEFRETQAKQFAESFFQGKQGTQKDVDALIKAVQESNPEALRTLGLFNNQLVDIRSLRDDARAQSLGTDVFKSLIEPIREEAARRTELNKKMAEAQLTLIDFNDTIDRAAAGLGRVQEASERAQTSISAGFNRIAGSDQVNLGTITNPFSNLRGVDRGSLTNSLARLNGIFGGSKGFQQVAELSRLDRSLQNDTRSNLFNAARANPNATVVDLIDKELTSGSLRGLSDAARLTLQDQISQTFRDERADTSISQAISSGELDKILSELGGGATGKSTELLKNVVDSINNQTQKNQENQNQLNRATLEVSQNLIARNRRADEGALEVSRLRGQTPDFIGLARQQNVRDIRTLVGIGGPTTTTEIADRIRELRSTDPNSEQIPRLIEALKLNAEETRELAAVNEELERLEKSRATAGSFLDRLTGNDFGERVKAQQSLNIARRISAGENVPLFQLNESIGDIREIFAEGNDAFRNIAQVRGGRNELESRLAEQQARGFAGNRFIQDLRGFVDPNNQQRQNLIGQLEGANQNQGAAAGALIGLAREQIVEQQKLIQQTQQEFINNLRSIFDEGLQGNVQLFNDGVNSLSASLSTIPESITLTGNHVVNVVFPQGNIFETLAPELQNMVRNTVAAEIDKLNNPGVRGR